MSKFLGIVFFFSCHPLLAQSGNEPFEITDNSFLIEEAFNQEAGVLQNIFTAHWVRDVDKSGQDEWSFSFTQEWPIAGQTHQFSFVLPFGRLSGDPARGIAKAAAGLGDLLINYRFQATTEEENGSAFAPRATLIVPTGDEEEGFGGGAAGFQFNLPLSKQRGDFYFHGNAGMTVLPEAGEDPQNSTVWGYHLGGSVIWRANRSINVLFETLLDVSDELGEEGSTEKNPAVFLSPGLRWGKWVGKTQVVSGIGLPFVLSEDSQDFSVFLYLSLEFPFQ